jgi:hypothetical protein
MWQSICPKKGEHRTEEEPKINDPSVEKLVSADLALLKIQFSYKACT